MDQPAIRLGRYRIIREIARGGMGIVYEAVDDSIGRRVALKVLRDLDADAALVRRFRREASITARLQHPNIVKVHEVDALKDESGLTIHLIAMELVEGDTLAQRMSRMSLRRHVEVLARVAKAVDFAHAQGVIHRDLKPANILFARDGRPVVIDFGLARPLDESTRLTDRGRAVGTPRYMSPEQVRGRRVDGRTDVWALGAILYEVLAGRPPFLGDSAIETGHAILFDDPLPPGRLRPGVPPAIEAACLRALEKDPDRRHATAQAFSDELTHSLAHRPAPRRRSRVAVMLGLAAGAWVFFRRRIRPALRTARHLHGGPT